ncbi:MAG: hypothetical protein L3J00_05105 [Thiomicrorhabdus sp.]|nr:hypothetical protein [Thiomicrorhabdus sp.]
MLINKKWILFTASLFILLLSLIMVFNDTEIHDFEKTPVVSSKIAELQSFENEHETINANNDDNNMALKSSTQIVNRTTKHNSMDSDTVNQMKIMQKIIELHKQRQNDPTTVLKISDLSEEEQAIQNTWLQTYKEKGFIEISELKLEQLELNNELVEIADLSSASVSIDLQHIDNTKFSNYEYIGAILDKDENNNNMADGVKRFYKSSDGEKISLYEKSVESTHAILTDEFVTEKIQGYPASRMTYCTENQRCVSEITLITANKQYKVSMKGDESTTKEALVEIVSSLELPILEQSNNL